MKKQYEKYARAIRKMRAWAELQDKELHDDCQAYIDGKIKTQAEISRKHGVTRACVSKRVSIMRPLLQPAVVDLVLSKARQLKRKTYGLRQMIVAQRTNRHRPITEAMEQARRVA